MCDGDGGGGGGGGAEWSALTLGSVRSQYIFLERSGLLCGGGGGSGGDGGGGAEWSALTLGTVSTKVPIHLPWAEWSVVWWWWWWWWWWWS